MSLTFLLLCGRLAAKNKTFTGSGSGSVCALTAVSGPKQTEISAFNC